MNNSLETLKAELISQKNAIITKGGTVTVAGTNPTPAEITAGINSIDSPNYELSNAQPEDVISGKTFFSGNSTLKTGTLNYSADTMNIMYFYNNTTASTNTRINYTLRSGLSALRQYAFYKNPNPVDFYFNTDLTSIGDYSFYQNGSFVFPNFANLSSLTYVGSSAFNQCTSCGIDFTLLPNSIRSIKDRAFQDCLTTGMSVYLPALTTFGQYAFYSSSARIYAGSLTIDSNFAVTTLPSNAFTWIIFNNDFVIPSSVTSIGSTFNYRGSFKSLTIPSTCTRLNDYCFGSSASDLSSYFNMKWIEFKSATPPIIGTQVFALQYFQGGAYIYVPDEAVDTYKAVSNLSRYASYIRGVSEKE